MSLIKKNFAIRKLVGGITLAAALVACLPFTVMAGDNVVGATDSFMGDGSVDGINSSVTGMDDVYDSIHTSTDDAKKVNADSDSNSGDSEDHGRSNKTLPADVIEIEKDGSSAEEEPAAGDAADTSQQKIDNKKVGDLFEQYYFGQKPVFTLAYKIVVVVLCAIVVVLIVIRLLLRGRGKH